MMPPGLVKMAAGGWVLAIALAIGCGGCGIAQAAPQRLIPSPGGEVAIRPDAQQAGHKSWHDASARRAGDYVYISGVVISRKPGETNTPATFKEQARAAFRHIGALLNAYGADFRDVVMINSFHDWSAPEFGGDRMTQFDALRSIKDEFMTEPHPAWTAVGTSGTIRSGGIVEIQMIAYVPQRGASEGGEQKQDDRAAHLDHTDG